ncbi:hypothetical protein D3C78_1519780 [compost metagenome]
MLPAGGAGLGVLQTIGWQLLQQQTAGAAVVGAEPEARGQLLGGGEVAGQAVGQGRTLQRHDALVALALARVDGEGQHAVRHQLVQAGGVADQLGVVAGQAAHFALAGALHHQ